MAEKKQKKEASPEAPAKKSKALKKDAPAAKTVSAPKEIKVPARLSLIYKKEIVPSLIKTFGYTSIMQAPKLDKIVVNMGVGEALGDKKLLDNAVAEMEAISGQKVVVTKARKSVAAFKLREGWPIGCKVTLRRDRMWEFMDRLIDVALPRVRDFRGINPKSFDGRGNYSMGVKEQIIFPEIEYDKVDKVRGMDVTITTTAKTNEEGRALLKALQFPFRN